MCTYTVKQPGVEHVKVNLVTKDVLLFLVLSQLLDQWSEGGSVMKQKHLYLMNYQDLTKKLNFAKLQICILLYLVLELTFLAV